MKINTEALTIRPETHKDYKDIVSLVLRSFKEGTDYSDGFAEKGSNPFFSNKNTSAQR